MPTPPDSPSTPQAQGAADISSDLPPKRTGLARLWHAFSYSLAGLRAAWREPAFRQEAALSFVLVPAAF